MSKVRIMVPIVYSTEANEVAPSLFSFTSSLATEMVRVLVAGCVNAIAGKAIYSSWNVERSTVQL